MHADKDRRLLNQLHFSITPAFLLAKQAPTGRPETQECPDELQHPLVLDPLGDRTHQFVKIDPIKEFLQIEINEPASACEASFNRWTGNRSLQRYIPALVLPPAWGTAPAEPVGARAGPPAEPD